MAYVTATTASPAIPEIWRTTALAALFSKMVAKNRILSVTEDIGKVGDILHVKIMPTPTVGDVTAASGAWTAEQVTITEATLTVNKWKYVGHDVVDIAIAQSDIDLVQEFSKTFVPALGEQIETDILALYSSCTSNDAVGDGEAGAIFDDSIILPAALSLDDNKVPEDERSFLLPPVAIHQLRKQDKWVDASKTGLPKGVMTTGIMTDIYGIPAYRTPMCATDGNVRKGLLLHRNGLMVGIQKNMQIEKFAKTQFSTPIAASALYGVAVCRNNHNVVLNIKKTLA